MARIFNVNPAPRLRYSFKMDRKRFSGPARRKNRRPKRGAPRRASSEGESDSNASCGVEERREAPGETGAEPPRERGPARAEAGSGPAPSESELRFSVEDETEKGIFIVEGGEFGQRRRLPASLMQILGRREARKSGAGASRAERRGKPGHARRRAAERKSPNAEKEDSGKFIKIYEPDKFFQQMPEDKKVLLYPFLISKQYVDSVIKSKFFQKGVPPLQSESLSGGRPGFQSQAPSAGREPEQRSDSGAELLSETQKCRKISKKLRRAWSLNQQIAQNVFKKVTLLYTSREDSEVSSRAERRRAERGAPENRENKAHLANLGLGKRGGAAFSEKAPSGRRASRRALPNPERNLRQTTKNKKKMESERLKRQRQERRRKPKPFAWKPSEGPRPERGGDPKAPQAKERGKVEVVEFLDYANKNIRKKNREKEKEAEGGGESRSSN